jgi:hypothetical protein
MLKRSFLFGAAVAGAALVSALPANAELLSGPELRKRIIGRTVYLAAPLGGEFPLIYRADGTVSGDGTSVGLGRFFATRETGRWNINGNTLCQQFPTWYQGTRLCFTVTVVEGNKIRWVRDNGQTGLARIGD